MKGVVKISKPLPVSNTFSRQGMTLNSRQDDLLLDSTASGNKNPLSHVISCISDFNQNFSLQERPSDNINSNSKCTFPLCTERPCDFIFDLIDDEIVLTDEILLRIAESIKPKPRALTNSHARKEDNDHEMLIWEQDYRE